MSKNESVTEVKLTEADKLWAEIKDRDIEMFALPSQKVSHHCTPTFVEPSKLYLIARSSAVLPALELVCGKAYVVELVDKYMVVSRSKQSLTK